MAGAGGVRRMEKMRNEFYIKYTLMSILFSTSLFLPIRVLYLVCYGATSQDISLLKMIFSVAVLLFEIPTGVVADKISRKLSLQAASLLFIFHALLYLTIPNFWGFALGQLLLGIANAFKSGADVAALSTYIKNETNDEYKAVAGKIQLVTKIISAVFMVIAGVIYTIDMRLNFTIAVIMGILNLILITSLTGNHMAENKKAKFSIVDYKTQIADSFQMLLGNKVVRKRIAFSSIFITIMIANFEYYQVQLLKIGFPIELNGILYASFMVFMGNGAFLVNKLLSKWNKRHLFMLMIVVISVSYCVMGLSTSIVMLVVSMLFQQLIYGSGLLVIEDYLLNEVSGNNKKSTVLSMNSLIVSIYKVVILFIITIFLNYFSVDNFYVVLSFVNILIGVYFYMGIGVDRGL